MTVKVTVDGGKVMVTSPYNTEFVCGAKRLGGKWAAPTWIFDAREERAVRDLCVRVYGTDGVSMPDLVTIKVTLTQKDEVRCGPITIFGRTVARAFGRDSGAKLGDGVVLLEGGFTSGGSRANWTTTTHTSGAVVLMHDIPRKAAEAAIAAGDKRIAIVPDEPPSTIDRAALEEERERLLARLAEINDLLSENEVCQ